MQKNQKLARKAAKKAKVENADVATILNYVVTKVQDVQEKFVVIIRSLLQQKAFKLPKSIVAKCLDNSKLYREIKCEEGREGCRDILKLCCDPCKAEEQKECHYFSKLCRDKGQGKW